MSEETNIQWASSTWNPWMGCDKVSPGCKLCYIVTTPAFRFRGLKHGDPRVRTSEAYWRQPYKWNREAGKGEGSGRRGSTALPSFERPRVFPSLCDWLDDQVPIEWLADFLKVIHDTPHLDWLLLTKRPENWAKRILDAWGVLNLSPEKVGGSNVLQWLIDWRWNNKAPANVWFGISAESQEWLEKRFLEVIDIPARVLFVSAEPLLGPLDFNAAAAFREGRNDIGIDWVIVGGESGGGARQCSVEWIWDIQMQCKAAGVACFVKQLGADAVEITYSGNPAIKPEDKRPFSSRLQLKHPKGGDPAEWPEELRVREFPLVNLKSQI